MTRMIEAPTLAESLKNQYGLNAVCMLDGLAKEAAVKALYSQAQAMSVAVLTVREPFPFSRKSRKKRKSERATWTKRQDRQTARAMRAYVGHMKAASLYTAASICAGDWATR